MNRVMFFSKGSGYRLGGHARFKIFVLKVLNRYRFHQHKSIKMTD